MNALPPLMEATVAGYRAIFAAQAPIANSIYECMDLPCLCPYLKGHLAPNGDCTLPNKQLLKKAVRFELALRQVDPSLSLPYWDSTLEAALDRRADSALFSAAMEGGTDEQGMVNSGPYVNFRTLEGRPNIKRAVGAQGVPMKQTYIDFVMRQSQVDQISTSANDPIFFPHHSFIDFIWEQWRQQRQSFSSTRIWTSQRLLKSQVLQTRADRETLYPPDNELCASPKHFAAAPMIPFLPMRNIDGLSNNYTDNLYEYAARPFCTHALPDCGSKLFGYLFCDLSSGQPRCAPKMKPGAACSKYVRGEAPCLNGSCQRGRCVAAVGSSGDSLILKQLLTTFFYYKTSDKSEAIIKPLVTKDVPIQYIRVFQELYSEFTTGSHHYATTSSSS
ncbi:unnamed protein product [Heligmosomoides polygyrus]|uniref:Tyrosinase_Cu-bd domain-containing protein n=1 Tax=Heligmosomoides polygyrus TaxID=6339 RepID=A0A3P8BDN9_HELPZ|nr:unnamed protein product [Heligmosomoides polygyrus]